MTVALAPATELHRPDGRPAPEAGRLAPPHAPPQPPGFVEVLASPPEDLALAGAAGRLVTPGVVMAFDGLGRVPKVGAGPKALVAAPGET